jgi:hypothetical protein
MILSKVNLVTGSKRSLWTPSNPIRESLSDRVITDFGDVEKEVARRVRWYNYERIHFAFQYSILVKCYKGNRN